MSAAVTPCHPEARPDPKTPERTDKMIAHTKNIAQFGLSLADLDEALHDRAGQ
jgi:hypothetical protein